MFFKGTSISHCQIKPPLKRTIPAAWSLGFLFDSVCFKESEISFLELNEPKYIFKIINNNCHFNLHFDGLTPFTLGFPSNFGIFHIWATFELFLLPIRTLV